MPLATPKGFGLPVSSDLGLGDMLGQQVKDETEEQRRRRLMLGTQQKTSAAMSLLGPAGGLGGGY